jgi:hypothetical protein
LQQAAVAEVVHSDSSRFDAARFRAKYGKDPGWGSKEDNFRYHQEPSALRFFFYGSVMPADLKARLKAFVPPPRFLEITALDDVPSHCNRPFERWNPQQRMSEKGTEAVPLAVHETERAAQRELQSVLRLVDAGKVAVSDKTRRASASTVEAITALLDSVDYYPHVPAKSKWDDENAGPIRAFACFRRNELHCLVLSKVGNFAIDLPDADVLIQVSGAFGSRQEEAQRLGRILRPKADGRGAHFFTLVSRDTREEEFAHHRKLFLTEQGYSYQVVVASERYIDRVAPAESHLA